MVMEKPQRISLLHMRLLERRHSVHKKCKKKKTWQNTQPSWPHTWAITYLYHYYKFCIHLYLLHPLLFSSGQHQAGGSSCFFVQPTVHKIIIYLVIKTQLSDKILCACCNHFCSDALWMPLFVSIKSISAVDSLLTDTGLKWTP